MDNLSQILVFLFISAFLELLLVVFSLLFMHFSAKHRNQKLSAGWYICGVFFNLLTLIVFLLKRKDFAGPETKVCWQCGDKFYERFEICPKCLIALPENSHEEKNKQKKLSRIFGIAVIVLYVLSIAFGIYIGAKAEQFLIEDVNYRISVDGVFYDKTGKAYEDENEVILYAEDGRTYSYYAETVVDEYGYEYEEIFYISSDGKKYFELDCYVTEDGWFYCDMAGKLEPYSVDTDSMTEEELEEYYESYMNLFDEEYRYYDYPYVDSDGNIYFSAYEASWNEKGELITSQNDVSIKE